MLSDLKLPLVTSGGPGKEWAAGSLNVSSIIQLSRALFNMNYTAIQSG